MTRRTNIPKEELSRTGGVSPETSRAIAILRFILPFAVIAEHSFILNTFHVKGMVYDFANYPISRGLVYFIQTFVADFAVPCFFFISGYLFFSSGFSRDIYRRKLKSRFWSLLVPYVLWNAIMAGYIALHYTPLFTAFAPSLAGQSLDMTAGEFFYGLTLMPHNGTLWFIRELIMMVVLSPLVFFLVKRFRWTIIGLFWCIWAACLAFTDNDYLVNLMYSVLFFSAGGAFAIMRKDPVAVMSKLRVASYVVFAVLGLSGFTMCFFTGYETALALKAFTVPCALFVSFTLAWLWGKSSARERLLGPHALSDRHPGLPFMIFAAHSLIIFDVQILVFAIVKPVTDTGVAACMVLTYICIALSIVVCHNLLCIVWPAAERLLTGRAGRKQKRGATASGA